MGATQISRVTGVQPINQTKALAQLSNQHQFPSGRKPRSSSSVQATLNSPYSSGNHAHSPGSQPSVSLANQSPPPASKPQRFAPGHQVHDLGPQSSTSLFNPKNFKYHIHRHQNHRCQRH